MGGGKKKPTMTQMAKTQQKEEKTKSKSSGRTSASSGGEKRTLGIFLPNPNDKALAKELQKMKLLTPYAVASRFNLRVSIAKDLLEELHRQGVIAYVAGGRHTKIYKAVA